MKVKQSKFRIGKYGAVCYSNNICKNYYINYISDYSVIYLFIYLFNSLF